MVVGGLCAKGTTAMCQLTIIKWVYLWPWEDLPVARGLNQLVLSAFEFGAAPDWSLVVCGHRLRVLHVR